MCGIAGYIGNRQASNILLTSLSMLEYRGYDSAGIAVINKDLIVVRKGVGKVNEVKEREKFLEIEGNIGIAHTRWATHGKVCEINAHPHTDCKGEIAIVHNGVLENYLELKKELENKGHKFKSETDSEIIAHLFEEKLKSKDIKTSWLETLKELKGSFAIVAIVKGANTLLGARRNSPLIIGLGNGENFVASDAPALLPFTKKIIILEENSAFFLTPEKVEIFDFFGKRREYKILEIKWSLQQAEKNGYPHFMLKEIMEQPKAIRESLINNLTSAIELLKNYKNVHLIGSGSSYHAALFSSLLLEKFEKNSKAYISSEYYFIAFPSKETLVIAISQSGETADTLQAVRYAKGRGAKILSITNVMGSSITHLSDEIIYMNVGPEISVAATKTFLAQLAILTKLIYRDEKLYDQIPLAVDHSLRYQNEIKKVAELIKDKSSIFFIGRALSYPLALEGALKLKEISYLHAEAYPAGELKHGPLSLIDENSIVISLIQDDETFYKMENNVEEVRARGAFTLAISNRDVNADMVIKVPFNGLLAYFSFVPILQLIAYYTSVAKNLDPDKPRNLAKSVTVE